MSDWVSKIVEDTSVFRRAPVVSALRRASPDFRRALVQHLTPSIESGSPEIKERVVSAMIQLVNEGQDGWILPDREPDLSPAVAAVMRIAENPADLCARMLGFS